MSILHLKLVGIKCSPLMGKIFGTRVFPVSRNSPEIAESVPSHISELELKTNKIFASVASREGHFSFLNCQPVNDGSKP
jgi:hypothetical protein